MELDSTMGGESKGKGAWVPFTPTKSVSARYEINSTGKGLNHDVGSVENPQLSHIGGELGHPEKENGSCGCEFGDSGRARFGRDQKIAHNCDGYVSNTGPVDGVKGADDCCGGVARKVGFMVSGNPGSSRFDTLGLHGKPEGIMGGMSDNRPNQETIEVKVSFASKKGTQLHNHNLHCEFGRASTKASSVPNNQTPKKRKRMKRHRPKVFDESKPVKPSTPKLQTPKRAKCVKKDSLKTPVEPPKDVDREAVGDYNKNSCRQKLDFNMENCIMNQNPKACNGIESKPEVEPKLHSGSRFSSSRVYQRIFRPNECLKNSRKLGPNCPNICKKTRMSRRRTTVFDKLIGLVSMIPTTQKQRRAAMNEPMNLYPMVKDRKTKSPTSSQRQKSSSTDKRTREAVKHPTFEKCTLNLTWMVNLKRKRSKTSTRRRDLSSFVNDLSKSQVSETFLLKASSIRTKDTGGDKLAARLEVQDDGIQHLETKKLIEQQELPQDNVVSRSGSIQKCPVEFGDRMLGVETDLPEHSLEIDMVNYQVVKSLESDVTTPYLVGPRDEEKNLLASRDYDAFTEALVDFASQKMEYLNLYDGSNQLVVRDQNGHGALIPSKEKFDPSKRRKPLPKVDLDAETMRVWNLLMENSGSEDTEQEDDDKAKYWKEQRELYRGRVESFLARMHLIQGDRRFSPWKGSVVDSVVGVFLTQNVSDHLSSSAFMSLAARFPPPSVSEHNGCDGRSDCVIHDIQQVKITGPPSGKCEELLTMEKYTSSSPSNQVGVDPENGNKTSSQTEPTIGRKRGKVKDKQENPINWDDLRKKYSQGISRNRMDHTIDSVNWEAVRQAPVDELAKVIMERGMNNILAGRIKDFLDRLVRDHGSIDLEWLRDVPPDKAKEYLLSIPGLGLKSVECVRLLSLHHHAFPVDTNVGRILVRLGWVPLQPLPEDVQIHLLNQYPLLDNIQKYFWPRLCGLKQQKLYETHCQFIALGKAICTKRQPNCNACPMRGECRHFASAFASARLRLEGSRGGNMATESSAASGQESMVNTRPPMLSNFDGDFSKGGYNSRNCEPIVEMPTSPVDACTEVVVEKDIEEYFNCESEMPTIKLNSEECTEMVERDREDFKCESEMPTIKLNSEEFIKNVLCFMDGEDATSKALITLTPEVASIPVPELKYVSRLRTVHHVYELPDSHPLLAGQFEKRDPDDLCPYLLAIWITDETTNSSQESRKVCNCQESTKCDLGTCSGETVQCQNDQIVQGTILIPCRTANRGSFPLNGTYFQLNEVFADHESSRQPIAVPREWIWNLRRRALYCGTSVTSICRGMSQEEIQCLFWKGFMCIRGIDRLARGPKPLARRFHVCKTRQVNDE